ncbi:MAG: enoyl-CoA hydratase, partial [Frankiales bacterium]|nr:enoyl-CoA hydratase [Frankiales bacterium]
MSAPEHLLTEKVGHTLVCTMNRPEAKNAFSPNMLSRMLEAWETADADDDIRVVILTGSADVFCAGADLKAMMSAPDPGDEHARRYSEDAGLAWKALLRHYRLTKPLIAAVEGPAIAGGTEILQATDIRVAGGTEILQATDIRVAGASAMFGVVEVTRALFPLGGSTVRLRRQI